MPILKVKDNEKWTEIPSITGESAYEIAVRHGFGGTEAEWLESLRGFPVVKPTEKVVELEANKFYQWGEVDSLTITLGSCTYGFTNEFTFEFKSGATPTNLNLPVTIRWASPLVVEPNKTYQVSIMDDIGVICGA